MADSDRDPPVERVDESTVRLGPEGSQPEVVPGFRLLQKLGEGGMGEVFEAEQLQPVRRRVAIKLIKRGMESRRVLARFETERQALAMMSHPNIARVFDAGTTTDGRPFFVMEHVPGVPLTRYCDDQKLSTRERLELLILVCDGVQHAHRKGVIHRDIKPSNVLVIVQDSKPVPKIIDFGIAKATSMRLTDDSVFTAMGEFIGTPDYMSPEQADLTGLDIDTRTDVYSLGVMLYEVLAGVKPFDTAELRRASFDEMRRVIRQHEPPRPSARLSDHGDQSVATAERRRTQPSTLERQLQGDLDWITMKALEKDRTRRYGSPAELAADIRRHLADEPVSAGPPSIAYRMRKFVRRHTGGVVAGVVVAAALVLGIAGTTIGMVKARNAERDAARKAETARRVSDFLVELFRVSDPVFTDGQTVTAREILDRGTERIDRELANEPLLQAEMLTTMSRAFESLGLLEQAEELAERSLHNLEEDPAADELDVASGLQDLGRILYSRADHARSRTLLERALEIRERLAGPAHPSVAAVLSDLGLLYVDIGEFDLAEETYSRALEIDRATLEPDDPVRAATITNFAVLQVRRGNLEEARTLFEQALEIRRTAFGSDHILVARSLGSLGGVLKDSGLYREALPLYEQSLTIKEKVLGPNHPDVAGSLSNLGALLRIMGELEQAKPNLERSISIYREALGPTHPDIAEPMTTLAIVKTMSGRRDEARVLFERALAIREGALGPEHPDVATSLNNLGVFHRSIGDNSSAVKHYRRSIRVYEASFGGDHPRVAMALTNLGNVLIDLGELEEAEACYRRALKIREDALGPGHPDVALTLVGMATLAETSGDPEAAIALLERALPIWEESLGPDHRQTAKTLGEIEQLRRLLGEKE